VEQVFKRFYPPERFARPQPPEEPSSKDPTSNEEPVRPPGVAHKLERYYSAEELDALAPEFAALTPTETYSVAELQGYLLNYKWDPQGAVDGMPQWMKGQEQEKAKIEEAKKKRKLQAAQRRKAAMEGSPKVVEGVINNPRENIEVMAEVATPAIEAHTII
jgi:hypothetical protein